MANSRLLVEDYAGVAVVTFTDSSILNSGTIDAIGKELYALADERNKQRVILDFTNVKFLASQTLGVLITLNKKLTAIKGSLALCSMRQELKKVFTISSLDKLFKFFPDDAAALAHFDVRVSK